MLTLPLHFTTRKLQKYCGARGVGVTSVPGVCKAFHDVRKVFDFPFRTCLLRVPGLTPPPCRGRSSLPSTAALDRWQGEPVRAVLLSRQAFLSNKRGFPCLSKRHQQFLARCFRHNIQVLRTASQGT
jgi:hypothetical protein